MILAFGANSALSRENETKIVKITHSAKKALFYILENFVTQQQPLGHTWRIRRNTNVAYEMLSKFKWYISSYEIVSTLSVHLIGANTFDMKVGSLIFIDFLILRNNSCFLINFTLRKCQNKIKSDHNMEQHKTFYFSKEN